MKMLLVLLTTLVLTISLAGCSGNAKGEEVIAKFQNLKTTEMTNYSMVMDIAMEQDGQAFSMEAQMDIYDENNMYMNYSVDAEGVAIAMEMYILVDAEKVLTMYMSMPGMGWIKSSDESLAQGMDTETFKSIIETDFAAESLNYVGTEEIEGATYDVVEVTLDKDTFDKLMAAANTADVDMENLDFSDIEYKFYLTEAGQLAIMKANFDIEGMKMDIYAKLENVGSVEAIVVPQEVQDEALDLTDLMGQ